MKSRVLKWWHAQFNLGWRSFVHYLKKIWPWREKYGLERFRANYVAEGLPAFSSAFREIAHEPGRCTTCGLCDAACPILREGEPAHFLGPMRLVISGMRGGPILRGVAEELEIFAGDDCAFCKKCEQACPEKIPILELAKGYLGQLNELNSLR